MYFESRAQAGELLAKQLEPLYRYENCVVLALSDGGVLVASEVAAALHAMLTLLIVEDIEVPGESVKFGGVSQGGGFTYNSTFSSGEIEEYVSEFHGYLDDQKREAFQKINRLVGDGGVIDHEMLRDQTVVMVTDGVDDTTVIDVAMDFLKPIRIQRLVAAVPVVSVAGVDKLHLAADELHVLDVKQNYMGTNHYYEDNEIPPHGEIVARINQIVLNWR